MTATKKARTSPKRRARSGPSEVAPGVFVGGWNDAVTFEGARFCVLDARPEDELPADEHRAIYNAEKDAPIRANLDELAELAHRARAKGSPVLFFCGHGVRRGPLAAAWYLHRSEGISLDQAYVRIRAARPGVETVQEWVGDTKPLADGSARPLYRIER